MGFWSKLGSAIGRGIEKVGEFVGSEKIQEVGRGIQSFCESSSEAVSKDAGETNEYDKEKARLDETRRVNEVLSTFSLSMEQQADLFEKNCIRETRVYFDMLIQELEKDTSLLKINTNRLNKAFREIEKEVQGSIKRHLAKRVSLDDAECLDILKLPAGQQKTAAMRRFSKKVFGESLAQLSEKIKEVIESQQTFLEEELTGKMDAVVAIAQRKSAEYHEMAAIMESDEQDLQEKVQRLQYAVKLCQLGVGELKEVG